MKHLLITAPLLLLLSYFIWSFRGPESTSGAPAGHTGSPGDAKTCTFCHGGTASLVPGLISSDIPLSGYVPGDTYNLSATVSHASRVKFGFSVSPQNSFGVQLGILRDTSVKTQLNGAGKYITHVGSGTLFPGGTASWNFQWIAPVAGTGGVTFYGAFNLSNNLSNSGGDIIQTSALTVSENTSTNLSESANISQTRIYPNPVTTFLQLKIPQNISGTVFCQVSDLSGKVILAPRSLNLGSGMIDINDIDMLASGMYVLNLETGKQRVNLPFVKQ